MNTLGIALVWCIVQVTLIGLLAGGLYLAGAAAASGRRGAPSCSPAWRWLSCCRSWR